MIINRKISWFLAWCNIEYRETVFYKFTEQQQKNCLCFDYNGVSSCIFIITKKMHETWYRLIKQVFIALLSFSGSLAGIANVSNLTTCISLNNQPCMTRPTLIDLNRDEYNQRWYCYTFMTNLDRCHGSCNSFNDSYVRMHVPNETKNKNKLI